MPVGGAASAAQAGAQPHAAALGADETHIPHNFGHADGRVLLVLRAALPLQAALRAPEHAFPPVQVN